MHGSLSDGRSRGPGLTPAAWLRRVPPVPPEWFVRPERATGIHGAGHIRRVCVHTLRLGETLGLPERERGLALTAALWHDIGRRHDGVEPEHGAAGAQRASQLGLADAALDAGRLSPSDLELVLFAVRYHSLRDDASRRAAAALDAGTTDGALRGQTERPCRADAALRLLWVLKDADALDRVRLGDLDPRYFRHPCTIDFVAFAQELYAELPA